MLCTHTHTRTLTTDERSARRWPVRCVTEMLTRREAAGDDTDVDAMIGGSKLALRLGKKQKHTSERHVDVKHLVEIKTNKV